VRYVGLTKDGLLVSAVRREARAIRKRVGIAPFAFPSSINIFFSLTAALVKVQLPQKTIRHGSSSSALGGVGAIRFGLSISDDNLVIEK